MFNKSIGPERYSPSTEYGPLNTARTSPKTEPGVTPDWVRDRTRCRELELARSSQHAPARCAMAHPNISQLPPFSRVIFQNWTTSFLKPQKVQTRVAEVTVVSYEGHLHSLGSRATTAAGVQSSNPVFYQSIL